MRSIHHASRALVFCVTMLLCGLMAASNHAFREVRQDKLLYDRAMIALQRSRFDIANITLQTLTNTYPNSEYADRANQFLQEPRIARCGGGFSNTPVSLCDPEVPTRPAAN